MIYTSNLGIPRIGANRELKFALEKYWKNQITAQALRETGAVIQKNNWILQKELGVDFIPSNDFSYYDHVLDTTILLGAIPDRFLNEPELKDLDLYFAMARGARSKAGQVLPAMEMTKWFDTNYHFLVPEINDNTRFKLDASKPLHAYRAARDLGIETRSVLLGPVTYLLLGKSEKEGFSPLSRLGDLLPLYSQLFGELAAAGAAWIQLDEPALCTDLDSAGIAAYLELFSYFSRIFNRPKIMLTSYFGDLTANAEVILRSPFDGLHIDLFNCLDPDPLLKRLDKKTTISLGVVDGRNVWKNNLGKSLDVLKTIQDRHAFNDLIIAPSCSMLHVPQDLELENNLPAEVAAWLAFARQKLGEIAELKKAASLDFTPTPAFADNRKIIQKKGTAFIITPAKMLAFHSSEIHLSRYVKRSKKGNITCPCCPLPPLVLFPNYRNSQPAHRLQKNEIDEAQYQSAIRAEIEKTIRFQEKPASMCWFTANLNAMIWCNISPKNWRDSRSPKTAGFNRLVRVACARPLFTGMSTARNR
jgi:5-methyltetrahydropteroyltriglutamate--homocysteine methyltransferase